MSEVVDGATEKIPLLRAVGRSLRLLRPRDRRRFWFVVVAQMATSFLDLAGVALFGVVGLSATGAITFSDFPSWAQRILGVFGDPTTSAALAGSVAVIACALLIGKSILSGFLIRRITRFLGRCQTEIAGRLVESFVLQPLAKAQALPTQESAFSLTGSLSAAVIGILSSLASVLTEVALLVVLGGALLFIDPFVTLIAAVYFTIVAVALQRAISSWSRRVGVVVADTSIGAYLGVENSVLTYRETFVTNRRGLQVTRLQGLLRDSAHAQADTAFVQQIPKLSYESALILGALLLTVWQVLTTDLPSAIALLGVFLVAGSRVVPSMLRLSGQLVSLQISSGNAWRVYALSDALAGNESVNLEGESGGGFVDALRTSYPGFSPHVEVSGLSFSYPEASDAALSGVNLSIPAGSSLAIVGSTGSGKSTLADLIMGIVSPDSGQVLISGKAPREAIRTWPGALAYVPQTVTMVQGSVRENVALGLDGPMINDELVWLALEKAHLAMFLKETRQGLDTVVGERGVQLSGGQRQRLGIARALYSRPLLIVLDEATSALDAETERAISETITGMSNDVTRITIAHRLGTVTAADLVIFLEDGVVAAAGTFDEVRVANANFDQQARLLGLHP